MIVKIEVSYRVYEENALISVSDVDDYCTLILSETFTLLDKDDNKVNHRGMGGHGGYKERIVEAIDNNSIPKDILTLIKYNALNINRTWSYSSFLNTGYVLLDLKDTDIVKFKLEEL